MSKPLSLWRMAMSLGVITLLSGALMGLVNNLTRRPIALAQERARAAAIAAVSPTFDTVGEPVTVDEAVVYPLTLEGNPVGYAVESVTHKGFSGDISLMYGFDSEGTVTGYTVLQHAETPGLGARIDQWFRMEEGRRSVIGRRVDRRLRVSQDGGDVDAITAATISSRAFLDALNRAADAIKTQQP